jgi:hypothetical protein
VFGEQVGDSMVPLREGFSKGVRDEDDAGQPPSCSCTTSLPFSLIMRRAPHSRTRVFEHVRRSVMRTPCAHEPPGKRQRKSRRTNGAETNSLHIHGRCLPLPFVSCRMFSSIRQVLVRYRVVHADMYVNCLNMSRINRIFLARTTGIPCDSLSWVFGP